MALLSSLGAASAFAQTISATTYPFTNATGATLEDMSSGTTQLVGPNLDDDASAVVNIGFDYWLVGTRYTQFSVNANGLMRLGATVVSTAFTNSLASSTDNPKIAPYFDDMWVGTNGKVHYKVVGSAPNRKLVVEWQNMQIPRVATGLPGAGTFQCWLYESTGRVEFVYGPGVALNTANGGASIGLANSATVFASITASVPSVSYAAANNVNTAAITSGTKFTFTPPTPPAPTVLTFSDVDPISMTLNWNDIATNEVGYAIYRSTDGGTTYAFATQTAANAISSVQSGLAPSTTYDWSVYAVTEGALSSALSGSQATTPAGSIVTGGSGNWSSMTPNAPWPGGVLPTNTDNVTIADGHTVILDSGGTCYNLTVGQGASGVLQWDSTALPKVLSVAANLTVAANGAFQSGTSGTAQTLQLFGNLTNNGTLDFSTNGNVSGATIQFVGSTSNTVSGTGATTDIRTFSVSKGTTANVLELMPTNFTVQGSTTDGAASAYVTFVSGTLKISGTFAGTHRTFTSAGYSIPAAAGFWLNNPNYTVAAQNGSPTVAGLLRVSAGTYNVGTSSGNSVSLSSGSTTILEGGTANFASRLAVGTSTNTITFVMSGGATTLNNVANTSTTLASFDLGTSLTSSVTMSGGTMAIRLANTGGSGPRDYRNSAGIQSITGGTLQLGDASSGAAKSFQLTGVMPDLVITNTSGNHTGTILAQSFARNVTINAGNTLTINGFRFWVDGSSFVNNGTLVGTTASSALMFRGAATSLASDGGITLLESDANADGFATIPAGATPQAWQRSMVISQTYSGTGTVTAPLTALEINNPLGVTLNAAIPNLVTARVNLFQGTLTNSNKVTVGNGGATSAATQVGDAVATAIIGGSYDQAPTFNIGTAGYTALYGQEGANRATSFEIPASRSIAAGFILNNNGVTLAGGGLTLTASLTLSAGVLTTSSANLLTLANSIASPPVGSSTSYVNGPLAVEFNVGIATNRTYAIGKGAAFRPVQLKSVNTSNISRTYTAEVINSPSGGTAVPPLSVLDPARYWSISNTANLNPTARVNLTYGADDNVLSQPSARLGQASTASGAYASIGGTATATIVESTVDLTPGSDFFTIALENPPIAWDGGASTSNWGDAANWNPDGVPTGTSNVSLSAASATPINVNGTFAVNNLDLGANITLSLTTNTLTVNGGYNQTAGTIDLGTGTLEANGSFTRVAGIFIPTAGTTLFSGTAAQAIGGGVTHHHVVFRNGGAGVAKSLTAGNTFTANGDVTVETTAQLALSAATSTTFTIAGNVNYGGVTGGANIGSLTFNLLGSGKTINGSLALRSAPVTAPSVAVLETNWLTDPSRAVPTGQTVDGKATFVMENMYALRKADADAFLQAADPTRRIVLNLDDATLVRNPAGFASLVVPPSPFEMALTVASSASYTLGDNISIVTGKLVTVNGRLNCSTFSIGGAGGVTVNGVSGSSTSGVLGTATASASGLGATILTTGTNSYLTAPIVEYNAAGNQTINAASHPAAAMMYTAGSGTKTLDANESITGDSGGALTKAALSVGAGSTFADGGFRLSFNGSGSPFDNIIVNGSLLSTGTGSISYEVGTFLSNLQVVDGTSFGDLLMNFSTSTQANELNATGTVNVSFRNLVMGGTAGTGTQGGTLRLNETGVTNVTVTGDVSIAPVTLTSTGGGFTGTAATTGTVTVLGHITSTSTATTQPIMGNTGANTLRMGGSAGQNLTLPVSATTFTGATLRINNSSTGVTLGGSGLAYTVAGTIDFANGNVTTGSNTLVIPSGGALTRTSGHVVGNLRKNVATGGPVARTFEVGTGADYAPVDVSFATVGTAGNLTTTTASGDHANLGTSDLDASKTANRNWTVSNGGVGFTTADVTLNYVATDLDGPANPSNFVVRKYDSPNWSSPTTGVVTATSTQATGITSFSDFAVGEILAVNHTITATAGAGGTISPIGAVIVADGGNQTFTITPDSCFAVADVLVDNVSVGAVTSYSFTGVITDHTIDASFSQIQYTITASAGAGGSILPVGAVLVGCGDDQLFTITPSGGFAIDDVLVDAVSVGAVASYTFLDVQANHTIAASFVATPVTNLNTSLSYQTITAAINAGATLDGHTLQIAAGNFEEQVVVNKALTLTGAGCGVTVIRSPVSLAASFGTPANKPVVFVDGKTVVIESLTVDGLGRGNANARFIGIGYWNAGGRVSDVCVVQVRNTPLDGAQHGVGVYSNNDTGGPYALELDNVTVTDFQKNAMALNGAGMTVDVHDCTATGAGYISATAQNGIQVSFGAGGSVRDSKISDIGYTPATFVASGLIVAEAATVNVSGLNNLNAITNVQAPVSWYDTNGTMDGIGVVGGADYGPIFIYNSNASLAAAPQSGRPFRPAAAFDEDLATHAQGTRSLFTVDVTNSCLTGTDVAGTVGIFAYTEGGALNVTATNNLVADWDYGFYNYGGASTLTANLNSITGNVTAGYQNDSAPAQDATQNWWGAADGPSGDGPGTGDAVLGGNVTFSPYLPSGTNAAPGCGFTPVAHTITSTAGPNGSIVPLGATNVYDGGSQSYTITPNACYQVADVLVDGVSVGAVTSYTFTNVTADHTIDASFSAITYTITATAGTGGSIAPSGPVVVACGADQTFLIDADDCYTLTDVLVDGISVGAVTSHTFTNVQANHTIAASFAQLGPFAIATTSGPGGVVSPIGGVSQPGVAESFSGGSLPAGWASAPWTGGTSTVGGGLLTVDGARANPEPYAAGVGTSMEFVATFAAVAFQHAGLGGGNHLPSGEVFNTSPWAIFSTGTSGTALQARVWTGGPMQDFTIPGSFLGAAHRYRIDWNVGTVDFFIDGSLVHSETASIVGPMRPAFSDFAFDATVLTVDWAQVNPYPVACGADLSFAITADACYQVTDVLVDGSSVGAVTSYSFTDVQADHTLDASFSPITYTITASAGAGGSIDPLGAVSVDCGTDQTFTIAPDACNQIADVLVDGVSVGAVTSYTFTNVSVTHTIAASFVPLTYTITATAGAGGSISPPGAVVVACGADQTFTMTPDPCQQVADVLVDGVSVGAVASYTFTNVTATHTIAASFVTSSSTITATAGAGGTINPPGPTTVSCGNNQAYTITPDACHLIGDVLVDGVSVGAVASYTFTNVTANHTIDASFVFITYNITASASSGGSITPNGAVSVNCGTDQAFTITPDPCQVVNDVIVDGVSVGAVTNYTFTNVTTTHTISASFLPALYTLTVNVVGSGSVNKIPNQPSYVCGSGVQLTPVPAFGYAFTGWSGDASGTNNPLNIVMDANKNITATFVDVATAVAENLLGPDGTLGVFPNPSVIGETHFVYRTQTPGWVEVSVMDVTGRVVRKITSGSAASGVRSLAWNGRDERGVSVSAGTYFVRMTSQFGVTSTKRLVVIR